MTTDFSHGLFVAGFLLFMGIRIYYHQRAAKKGGRMNGRDSRFSIIARLVLAIPLVGTLLAYMIRPEVLAWAEVAAPTWVSWVGAGLTVITVPLLIWVQESLGANFNTILGVRERHTLVTHGPYRRVRHPMYDVLFLYMLSILLLTGNLLVGGVFMGAFLLTIATRVAKEEAILEEVYGDMYRSYRLRTGRFLPRLWAGG